MNEKSCYAYLHNLPLLTIDCTAAMHTTQEPSPAIPNYKLNTRAVAVITAVLVVAMILFVTGNYGKRRDCRDGSALPNDWLDDVTYQKPYHPDTFAYGLTFIFALLLPVLIVAKSPCVQTGVTWTVLFRYAVIIGVFYAAGAGISNGIVDNLKRQLCSLRPYAALRPDDPDSYLSTPSGHSNMVVFTNLYVSYWYLKSIPDNILKVGFCMLMSIYPFIVCATRITDNHHWPIDVIAGSSIGTVVALSTFVVIESIEMDKNHRGSVVWIIG